MTMNNLGQKIREAREKQNLFLREVAAYLEVDTALISKVENGIRNLSREQVVKLAPFLNASEKELISLWLCDKIVRVVGSDNYAEHGMKKAANRLRRERNERK
jgi:transcriptional regulator with XRE-family HTH domain